MFRKMILHTEVPFLNLMLLVGKVWLFWRDWELCTNILYLLQLAINELFKSITGVLSQGPWVCYIIKTTNNKTKESTNTKFIASYKLNTWRFLVRIYYHPNCMTFSHRHQKNKITRMVECEEMTTSLNNPYQKKIIYFNFLHTLQDFK